MKIDIFKYIPKMANPALIFTSLLSLKPKEWSLINKTGRILAVKLSKIIGAPINVSIQDLLDSKNECTKKEHELIPFFPDKTVQGPLVSPDEQEPEYYICVHCLQQFKAAKLKCEATKSCITKTFFDGEET